MSEQRIKCVAGQEPNREGEYPDCMYVAVANKHLENAVDRIEVEEQNLGTYGIVWLVAYHADGHIIKKMNAANIVSIEYFPPEK